MIETGPAADLAALARLRDVLVDADNRADSRAFVAVLAEDAIIMAPGLPPLVGLESCAAFVTDVLAAYPQRHVEETIDEVHVSGDLAFDRGSFVTAVFDPELDRQVKECGMALRVYRRSASGWKMARVMWHAANSADDGAVEASAPA
jgi:ketosteroid isomerase-like protein